MLKLALTKKWIAALIGCIGLGLVFAALAQWQVERSILPSAPETYSKIEYQNLEDVAEVGKPFTFQEVDAETKVLTQVAVRAKLNPASAVLVLNRFQEDGAAGSWLVIPTETNQGTLFAVVGFISENTDALNVLAKVRALPESSIATPLMGRYLPSEAPENKVAEGEFASMSVAQLLNEVDQADSGYSGFLAVTRSNSFTKVPGVAILTIGLAKMDSGMNWLSFFYALEWIFFGLFALFMWWRLLADAYRKQQEELLELSA